MFQLHRYPEQRTGSLSSPGYDENIFTQHLTRCLWHKGAEAVKLERN